MKAVVETWRCRALLLSVLAVAGRGGVLHGRVCWGLKDRRSLTVSLPLLPPAGDPSRCGCVRGEAENPNGRRYEKPQCWCVTAQCCEASSSSLVKYVTCSSEHVTSTGSPGHVAVLHSDPGLPADVTALEGGI